MRRLGRAAAKPCSKGSADWPLRHRSMDSALRLRSERVRCATKGAFRRTTKLRAATPAKKLRLRWWKSAWRLPAGPRGNAPSHVSRKATTPRAGMARRRTERSTTLASVVFRAGPARAPTRASGPARPGRKTLPAQGARWACPRQGDRSSAHERTVDRRPAQRERAGRARSPAHWKPVGHPAARDGVEGIASSRPKAAGVVFREGRQARVTALGRAFARAIAAGASRSAPR